MDDAPRPASAADFRARRDHPLLVKLPVSGLTVRLRRLSLLELAAAGRIPDELTTLTLSTLAEDVEEARAAGHKPADARRMLRRRIDLFNTVACALIEEPAVSMDGAGNSLAVDDLPMDDRIYLYGVSGGTSEVRNLAPFPDGPGADLAPVAHGGALREQAIELPADR